MKREPSGAPAMPARPMTRDDVTARYLAPPSNCRSNSAFFMSANERGAGFGSHGMRNARTAIAVP